MQEFDKKITQNLHVCNFCTTFAAFLKGFITKMAKVITPDGSRRRGKLDKQSNEVHRIGKNGEEQTYVLHPSSVPPTKAQNFYRKNFGKINAVVNSIVADPLQAQQWQERPEGEECHLWHAVLPDLAGRWSGAEEGRGHCLRHHLHRQGGWQES